MLFDLKADEKAKLTTGMNDHAAYLLFIKFCCESFCNNEMIQIIAEQALRFVPTKARNLIFYYNWQSVKKFFFRLTFPTREVVLW